MVELASDGGKEKNSGYAGFFPIFRRPESTD